VQRELNLAKRLIQSLATSFEPDKFKNQFRGSLNQLIESRAATRQIAPAEAVGPPR
jgi:non-homologous end joining protein Ku